MNTESLAWLAGIIDGEGTITAQVVTLSDGRVRIMPFVGIVNTDEGILGECRRIFDVIGVSHRTYSKPIIGYGFEGRQACSNMRVSGFKRLKILLPLLIPYLHSNKRGYADKILQFIVARETGLFSHDGAGHIRRRNYARSEIELISSVRTHSRARSLESLLTAPNVIE